jgi:hypothetical protein
MARFPLSGFEISGSNPSGHTNVITLTTCSSLPEAHLIQSVLRGSGIEAFIPDELTVQNDWGLINAIGGIRVQVQPEDEADARNVLSGPRDLTTGTD